tara:strand:- start:35 stop:478 length:444 start_codon:yes stop_codon:yes gene_type:complete
MDGPWLCSFYLKQENPDFQNRILFTVASMGVSACTIVMQTGTDLAAAGVDFNRTHRLAAPEGSVNAANGRGQPEPSHTKNADPKARVFSVHNARGNVGHRLSEYRLLDDRGDDAGAAKTKRAEARFALPNCVVGRLAPSPMRSSITR